MHVVGLPDASRRARGVGEGLAVDWDARLAVMLDLDDRIREVRDAEGVIALTARVLGRELDLVRVGYALTDTTGDFMLVSPDWVAKGHDSLEGMHDMRRFGDFAAGMRDGRLVVVTDTSTDPRTDADAFAGIGVGAMVNVPFVEGGRVVAFLFVNAHAPRAWGRGDLDFLRLAAGRLHDAVERRRAEAALREQAAILLDQAAAAAGERDRLWDATRDLMGSCREDGTVVDVNPAWCRAVGWPARQVRGTHYLDTVHPDDRAATVAEAGRVRAGERSEGFVNRLVTVGGDVVSVSWNAVYENGVTHFTGRDITGQLAAEEALRQSQKMEAVGNLTGGLAHDFNNILSGLSGAFRLARKALDKGRHDDCRRLLDMASESVDRGTAIVQRLLAFSRRQALDPVPTDVGGLVEGMVALVRTTVGSRFDVSTEVEPGLWPARVDPSQVDNAILNLCINARDAMPGGGSIRILARNVVVERGSVHGLADGHYVSLGVRDTRHRHGPGDAGPRLRPVLHDEAGRRRHRPRPVHGPRVRDAVGRHRKDRNRPG